MATNMGHAGKVRAGLVVGSGGQRFLIVGANVYWDSTVLGIPAEEIVGSVDAFYSHEGRSYFRMEDLIGKVVRDRPTVSEIHADLTARLVNA